MRTIAALLSLALLGAAPSPQAVSEKERGDRLAQNGDVAGAREAYENAIKLSPGYAAAINEIGILLVGQDKKEEAIEQFKKAVAADPRFALAHNNMGFVLRKLGRFAEAVESYKAYASLEPKDAAGLFGLAEAYKGAGDKLNALKSYEAYLAMDADPKNQKRIDKAKGFAEALRGELGPAAPPRPQVAAAPVASPAAAAAVASPSAASSTAATPAAPATAAAAPAGEASATKPAAATVPVEVSADRVALAKQKLAEGLQLRAAGDHKKALFAMQDATNADPNNAQAIAELAVSYAMLNHYPQAIERWEKVLAMPADDATKAMARQNLETARQKMGGSPTAAAAAAQPAAATKDPAAASSATSATTSAGAASAAAAPAATTAPAVATADPATATAASAATAPPAAPAAEPALTPEQLYSKGVELYSAQRYAEALKLFDAAILARAQFPQAFTARGSVNFALRDYNKALADYSQAMRLDNTQASPVFGVAEALTALGRKADAIPYYRAYAQMQAPDVNAQLQAVARQRIADAGQ